MERKKVKVEVCGKLNLSLNITGRIGAYHALDTVMASVNIADAVTVCERLDDKICVEFSSPEIDANNNCVIKAVELLRAQFGNFGADIYVEKKLPVSGGMGGSSADSAGVLLALDSLYNFSARGLNIERFAEKLGSDVNFMLRGGYARCRGRGEIVSHFNCGDMNMVLVFLMGVLTKDCFLGFDSLYRGGTYLPADNDKLVACLEKGDLKGGAKQFKNALDKPAAALNNEIEHALKFLEKEGAMKSFMTGSGSTCAAVFETEAQASICEQSLTAKGYKVLRVKTVEQGIKFYR